MQPLTIGTQVVSTPPHPVNPALLDLRYGFVTSIGKHGAFVRYWKSKDSNKLRTVSCSELTPVEYLTPLTSHDQAFVDGIIQTLESTGDVPDIVKP